MVKGCQGYESLKITVGILAETLTLTIPGYLETFSLKDSKKQFNLRWSNTNVRT